VIVEGDLRERFRHGAVSDVTLPMPDWNSLDKQYPRQPMSLLDEFIITQGYCRLITVVRLPSIAQEKSTKPKGSTHAILNVPSFPPGFLDDAPRLPVEQHASHALPPKADIKSRIRDVRFVPKADMPITLSDVRFWG
jgi:hypothetical protein